MGHVSQEVAKAVAKFRCPLFEVLQAMRISRALLDAIASSGLDSEVKCVFVGAFITAVWAKRMGMAYTILPDKPHVDSLPIPNAGRLTELSCYELAQLALSSEPPQTSVGVAAMNALLVDALKEDMVEDGDGADVLARVGEGKRVALIGHFPFVNKLRSCVSELMVFEKRPLEGDLRAEEVEKLLPSAQVVAITGSAFVNHTIEHLLELSRDAEFVMVIGPSTPLSEVLFEFGVDVIAGSVVVEPDVTLKCISEGAVFKQLRGVRRVLMRRTRA